MPGDAANLDARVDGDGGSDELTCEFLPGLEPEEIVEEAGEKNYGGGGEEISDDVEVAADYITELIGRKKKKGQRARAGDEDGDAANAGDRTCV